MTKGPDAGKAGQATPPRRRAAITAVPDPTVIDGEVVTPSNNGKATKPPTIEFRGRTMPVRFPTAEQLTVWNRTARRASEISGRDITNQEAATLLDRVLRIIQSVLDEQADRDWVEDQLLDGGLTLAGDGGATDIISMTVELMRGQAEADAPTTGPAAKARRRR